MTLHITTRGGRPAVASLGLDQLVIREGSRILLDAPVWSLTRSLVGSVVGDHAARIMALVAE